MPVKLALKYIYVPHYYLFILSWLNCINRIVHINCLLFSFCSSESNVNNKCKKVDFCWIWDKVVACDVLSSGWILYYLLFLDFSSAKRLSIDYRTPPLCLFYSYPVCVFKKRLVTCLLKITFLEDSLYCSIIVANWNQL